MLSENFQIQVKTFFGLEDILSEEIKKLGGRNVEIRNRAVSCVGDLGFLYKLNYSIRTGIKILIPILSFKAFSEEKFYDKIFDFPWKNYIGMEQTFAIDATVNSNRFRHSQFMTLKMKDAIVDYFIKNFRSRPSINIKNSDIKFHLHIDETNVTISLDSSGSPLYKRGYRVEPGDAPINEVLASGMLAIAGWDGKGNFLDPMCGSGTLLIEAGIIALDLPAQIFRKEFSFMNWSNYNADLFKKIKEYRINKIKNFNGKIIGYDIDENILNSTIKNIKSAEMEDIINIKKIDFFDSKKEISPLLLVFNPPYNERLKIQETDFYKKIGDTLKNNYPNTFTWFISADLEASKKIGLKPNIKIKLFNGKLECRFLKYETYDGSKKRSKLINNSD